MAVYKVLPEKNLRAVDIRDTLLANGADWSNEVVKNANYLPNYFKKASKINKWSKLKPYNSDYPLTDDVLAKKDLWGLTIPRYTNLTQLYNDIKNGIAKVEYRVPSNMLRLSDFAGYNTLAQEPMTLQDVKEINTREELIIEPIKKSGDKYNIGYDDIYPDGFNYTMVRIEVKDVVTWGTLPLRLDNSPVAGKSGMGEIFFCITNREMQPNEPPQTGDAFMAIPTSERNPYPVNFVAGAKVPYDMWCVVVPRFDSPRDIDVEITIKMRMDYHVSDIIFELIDSKTGNIVSSHKEKGYLGYMGESKVFEFEMYNYNDRADSWKATSGGIVEEGLLLIKPGGFSIIND